MKETKTPFILTYLMNIWTPTQMIREKEHFSIGKLCVIVLFLLALLLTPFTLNKVKEEMTMSDYLPHCRTLLNQTTMHRIDQLSLEKGEKRGPEFDVQTKEGRVMSTNQSLEHQKIKGNAIVFGKKDCLISDENGKQMMIHYPNESITLSNQAAPTYRWLSQLWQSQNQLTFHLLFLWTSFTIVFGLFALVVLGGMVGLFFVVKRTQKEHRVKTSFTLTLLAAGLPTMVSSFAGIICHDPMLTLQLQMALWVLMIALIFCKLLVPTLNISHELKATFWKGNSK